MLREINILINDSLCQKQQESKKEIGFGISLQYDKDLTLKYLKQAIVLLVSSQTFDAIRPWYALSKSFTK